MYRDLPPSACGALILLETALGNGEVRGCYEGLWRRQPRVRGGATRIVTAALLSLCELQKH